MSVAPVAGVAGSVEVDKGATNGPFLVGFKSYILRHNPYIIWRNQVNLWTTLWTVRSGIDNVSAICLAVCLPYALSPTRNRSRSIQMNQTNVSYSVQNDNDSNTNSDVP